MTTLDLIRKLKEIRGISDSHEVYLKASTGGQWGELVLRRATDAEKQKGGIAPEKWAAVIAADGDKKLTVKSLIDGLRHLPEIAEVYAMLYADAEPGRPGVVAVLGLRILHEDGRAKKVVALSAQEISPKNAKETC